MPHKGKAPASAWGQNYTRFIARLRALGCVFCVECHAYLAADHHHPAPDPVNLPAPPEAYAFAAELRND